MFQSKK